MKWKKVDEYHTISDSGYRVAKNFHGNECKFSAYTPGDLPDNELLGFFKTSKAAAKACEEHAGKTNRREPEGNSGGA